MALPKPNSFIYSGPGREGKRPLWRQVGNSLQYEREFETGIQMVARAKLENDGVRFGYEFTNRSKVDYDMIYAVTDPRLTGIFHDVRLERTYVHHKEGFDLLLAGKLKGRRTQKAVEWINGSKPKSRIYLQQLRVGTASWSIL